MADRVNREGRAASCYRVISAASNNAASIVGSYQRVHGYHIFNTSAAAKSVKLYNKVSAPNPAADAALLKMTLTVPAGGGAVVYSETGLCEFSDGLAVAIVANATDADNTAVAAGDVILNLFHKG